MGAPGRRRGEEGNGQGSGGFREEGDDGLAIADCVHRILGVPLSGEPIPRGQFEMNPSPRPPEQQVDTHLPRPPKTEDDLRGEEIAAEVRQQLGVPLGPSRGNSAQRLLIERVDPAGGPAY